MRFGYVGVGNMGARFVPRLLEAGHTVAVYDRRTDAVDAMAQAGAQAAGSALGALADADAVFTSLPNPSAVESVALGDDGLVHALAPGQTFVDMSTSPPGLARRIAEACAVQGAYGLDAPVSNGGVFVTVGGPRQAFDRLSDAFGAMCEHVIYAGEAGQGQVAKLARQYVSFTGFFTLVEALEMAAKAGADVPAVAEFIGESTGLRGPGRALGRLFAGDFGEPATSTAKLDIVSKDVGLAEALAREVGAPSGTVSVAAGLLRHAQQEGWGELEYWVAARIIEAEGGAELRFD